MWGRKIYIRKKLAGFPLNSIQFCLNKVGLKSINDVDYISVNSNPYYNLKEKLIYAFKNIFTVNFIPRLFLLKKHSVYNVLKENFKEIYKKKN